MVGAVIYISVHAQYRGSAQNTCLRRLFDTRAHRRDILLGDSAAHHSGLKQQCGRLVDQDIRLGVKLKLLTVGLQRRELNFTMAVLSTSAGLLRVLGVHFHFLGERFLVSNLRSAYIGLHLEFTQQTVHNDLQMQFAHTCDNGLACLRIGVGTEGRILLCQLRQRLAHLALAGLGLGLDRQFDNGLGELHGFQNHRMLLIADGVTGGGELKAHCRRDIPGIYLIQLRALVSMHLQNTSHALLLVLGGVQHIGTGVHGTGIYTEERQLAHEGIRHDLECQSGERLIVGRMPLYLVAIQVCTLDGGDIGRSGHIFQNGIQKFLHAFIAVSRTAAYRYSGTLTGGPAQGFLQILHRRLLTLQVHHHQIIIQFTDLLDQFAAVQLRIVLHLSQIIGDGDALTLVIVVDIGLHLKQVDDAFKFVLLADGQLQHDGVLAQTGLDLLHGTVEIGAQDIHLVDKCHTGYVVGVSLTPYVLGLRLHTTLRTEYTDSAVQYTQGTLYFNSKVNVARSVNDVDTVL